MKLLILLTAVALMSRAQTPPPVKVTMCFTPEGGTQICHDFQPNTSSMVTVDLRQGQIPVVVVQPIPAYQMTAMQSFVTGQTYKQQNLTTGQIEIKRRFDNVQDLLLTHLVRNVISGALKLYPATGEDTGKTDPAVLKNDLLSVLTVYPAFVLPQ